MLAADVHAALGIARLQVELARRLGDLLEQEVGVEAHAVALHRLPGATEELERLVAPELDAELRDDAPPATLERRERLLAEDLVARHSVDQHVASSLSSRAASAASSRRSPVRRSSSGRPSSPAARFASARRRALGFCASQTTRV